MIKANNVVYVFVYCDLCFVQHRAQERSRGSVPGETEEEMALRTLPTGWVVAMLSHHSDAGVRDELRHVCPSCAAKLRNAQVTP